ncbi:flagellar basal body-associated FliL family protein [Mesorhizobium sp. KR1-2]|uniref:flagellar basal body-associated FliL family protein n=1 Tax=Mesorhizobium sp. KR1-2 TaxID=3156609 RepID=UPI0032B42E3A
MSLIEQIAPQPKGPSLIVQGAVLLAMTAAAIGLGWVSGQYLHSRDAAAKAEAAAAEGHDGKNAATGEADTRGIVVELAPITTNLGVPGDMWVRLEASIVVDQPPSPSLADDIHQDLLAFLRTVRIYQIEGASGFRNLKTDLEERARIRSDGHVKHVLIRTLLFE